MKVIVWNNPSPSVAYGYYEIDKLEDIAKVIEILKAEKVDVHRIFIER